LHKLSDACYGGNRRAELCTISDALDNDKEEDKTEA
tara:strand:+ start:394 stop:501 length:108 start_codon:yes stop_codon:yes gene_type:complete